MSSKPIPVVDLFAGPGGLGEGFSRVEDEKKRKVFKTVISIEKDPNAIDTLRLRSLSGVRLLCQRFDRLGLCCSRCF